MSDLSSSTPVSCQCLCQVRGFTQAAILLRLAAKPAHGYELLDGLRTAGEPCCCDTGLVYRTLRQLEREGLASSSWETGGVGPARRVYMLTDKGSRRLHGWAQEIETIARALQEFLAEYHLLDAGRHTSTEGE